MTVNDCIIFGGGPAGCAAALRLRQRFDANVLVIDRTASMHRYQIGESASPAVPQLLAKLGLTEDLAELGHLPCYGNRSAWGCDAISEQDFLFKGQGFGWHLNRSVFDQQLRAQAEANGVRFLHDFKLMDLGWVTERNCWGLVLCDEQGQESRYMARSLIDASGNRAVLAQRFGARRLRLDDLMAVAMLTASPAGLDNLSLIEATEHGWWYAADIPVQRQVVSFMTDADILKQRGLTELVSFLAESKHSQLISSLFSSQESSSELFVYPAHSAYLDRVAGPGWLAVGNATMSLDPLTASGIHCALQDGIRGADAIVEFLNGQTEGMVEYARQTNQALHHYLAERRAYYQLEQRWPQARFWSRRHTAGEVLNP